LPVKDQFTVSSAQTEEILKMEGHAAEQDSIDLVLDRIQAIQIRGKQ
jgi:hypothetical protein